MPCATGYMNFSTTPLVQLYTCNTSVKQIINWFIVLADLQETAKISQYNKPVKDLFYARITCVQLNEGCGGEVHIPSSTRHNVISKCSRELTP